LKGESQNLILLLIIIIIIIIIIIMIIIIIIRSLPWDEQKFRSTQENVKCFLNDLKDVFNVGPYRDNYNSTSERNLN